MQRLQGEMVCRMVCIAGASALAAKMAPLKCRAYRIQGRSVTPPVQKGRGDRSVCSAHRGTLLLPSLSKAVHRTLRPRLEQHFVANPLSFQIGGKKGQSTSHKGASRLFMRRALRRCAGSLLCH